MGGLYDARLTSIRLFYKNAKKKTNPLFMPSRKTFLCYCVSMKKGKSERETEIFFKEKWRVYIFFRGREDFLHVTMQTPGGGILVMASSLESTH